MSGRQVDGAVKGGSFIRLSGTEISLLLTDELNFANSNRSWTPTTETEAQPQHKIPALP